MSLKNDQNHLEMSVFAFLSMTAPCNESLEQQHLPNKMTSSCDTSESNTTVCVT